MIREQLDDEDYIEDEDEFEFENEQNKQYGFDGDFRINFIEDRRYRELEQAYLKKKKEAEEREQNNLFKGDNKYILTLQKQQQEKAFSGRGINISKATESIKTMYELINISPPKIIFVETIDAAFDYLLAGYKTALEPITFSSKSLEEWELILLKQLRPQLVNQLSSEELSVVVAELASQLLMGCLNYHLRNLRIAPFGENLLAKLGQCLLIRLTEELIEQKPHLEQGLIDYEPKDLSYHLLEDLQQKFALDVGLEEKVRASLGSQLDDRIWSQLWHEITRQADLNYFDLVSCIQTEVWLSQYGYWFEYFINELGCTYPRKAWEVFQLITEHCGWIFAFEELCIVCERLSIQQVSK